MKFRIGQTVKVVLDRDPLKGKLATVEERWSHNQTTMYTVHVSGQGDLVYAEHDLAAKGK